MTRTDKCQLNKLALGLLCGSVLFIFAGCKTATAPDTDATTPAEMNSDETVEKATESVDPKPENIAAESGRNTKQKTSGTTPEPGPGEGAPPREEVQEAMEKMEDSLGPLEAVPGVPEA